MTTNLYRIEIYELLKKLSKNYNKTLAIKTKKYKKMRVTQKGVK